MGDLCLSVPGLWKRKTWLGGERWGRIPTHPRPLLGMGDLPLALFAQVWTQRLSLTCLLKVAQVRFEPGAAVPDSLGQKWPLARLLCPFPPVPSSPSALHPHPIAALDSIPERTEDVDGGVSGYTHRAPPCLARRRCYISICSCYYFSPGGFWHLASQSSVHASVASTCQGSGVR